MKRYKFLIRDDGIHFEKFDRTYKWESINKIAGYLEFILDSDTIVITIEFDDGFKIEIDETYIGLLDLMNNILPQKLQNFNTNWYVDINTINDQDERIIIFKK